MQFFTKTFNQHALSLLSVTMITLLISGCGGTDQTITTNSVEPTAEQTAAKDAYVTMNFATGDLPFPHDALFSDSEDGTLNIPVANATDYSDPKVALNTLDGFSTSAPIGFSVSKSLLIEDSNENEVVDILETGLQVFATTSDPMTKQILTVDRQLIAGEDYVPVIPDAQSDARNVVILPLKPLEPKTTYLITVNSSMKDANDKPLVMSPGYELLRRTVSSGDTDGSSEDEKCASLVGTEYEPLDALLQMTCAHIKALDNASSDPTNNIDGNVDSVVASWSFTTQSINDVFARIQNSIDNNPNESLRFADTDETTQTLGLSSMGAASIYAGTLDVPYYGGTPSQEVPAAPLNRFWLGQQDKFLTQFNVNLPKENSTQIIPVLMTVPNTEVLTNLSKPATGWPVVIFQHGITRHRGDLLAIADSLAAAGLAGIAIDMPLHGITPTDQQFSDLRSEDVGERIFNIDYVTQDEEGAIVAEEPDGVLDSSGRHFVNLQNLLVTRDNMRQGVADLMQLQSAVENLDTDLNTNADDEALLDVDKIQFVGHSLGAMLGGVYSAQQSEDGKTLFANVYAMPGTQAAYILTNSPTFAPEINAGLAQNGVEPGTDAYNQFVVAAQTVMDSADPVNYVAKQTQRSLVIEVVGNSLENDTQDQVIPNAVTSARLAGTDPWVALQNASALTEQGQQTINRQNQVMKFTAGTHASLLDPTDQALVTTTMQKAVASFLASEAVTVEVDDNQYLSQP